jgi:threonine/homoserine/homoserine lactone efflux protein
MQKIELNHGATCLSSLPAHVDVDRADAMAEANILGKKSVITGVLVQLTNPKAFLFVSALLPQFLDPTKSPSLQLTVLVLTTIAVDAVVLCAYALLACRGAHAFWALSIQDLVRTRLRCCASLLWH